MILLISQYNRVSNNKSNMSSTNFLLDMKNQQLITLCLTQTSLY